MNYVSVELETCWLNCGSIILGWFSMTAYTVHFRFGVELLPLYEALDLMSTWYRSYNLVLDMHMV